MDRNPPDPLASSDLLRMFEKDAGTSVEVDFETAAKVFELKALKAQAKTLEEQIEAMAEPVKLAFRDAAVLTVEGKPIATWKTQDNNRFNEKEFSAAHPDLYAAFKRNNPIRVLRIK
jgi:predicted phage-related endonuclease